MTSRSLWMAIGIAALMCAGAAAEDTIIVKAQVPFDFMVGDTRLPAGEYTMTQNRFWCWVQLSSWDTAAAVAVFRRPAGNNRTGFPNALVFNKYGSRYFLKQIWAGAGVPGVQVPTSRAEKEEMAHHAPEPAKLIATRAR